MKNLISIIIPTYNAAPYLKKCISSVLNQTNKDFELIIVDDGSSDNSKEIIKSFQDERIKYYYQSNQGLAGARNTGIKKSNGSYILFIDSDDYIEHNALEELYKYISKDDLDMIAFGFTIDFEYKHNHIQKYTFDKNNIINNKYDGIKTLIENDLLMPAWNKLYKKEIIVDNNTFFTEKSEPCEDIIFNLDYCSYINKIMVSNKSLYYYVKRNKTSLGSSHFENLIEKLSLKNQHIQNFIVNNKIVDQSIIENLYNIETADYEYFVLNMYRKDCKLKYKEKKEKINSYIFNAKALKIIRDSEPKVLYTKIFRFLTLHGNSTTLTINYYIMTKISKLLKTFHI